MIIVIEYLAILFVVVLLVISIAPFISKKLKIPIVVIEIIIGVILGKSFLDIVPDHSVVEFFSSFGLIYLMFLAGLEVNFEKVRKYLNQTLIIGLVSIIVPFVCGFFLAKIIGVNPLLLGTIFSTTSLGLVLPFSKEVGKIHKFSSILIGSVILVDILSMFLLAFTLIHAQGDLSSSFVYSLLFIMTLFLLPWMIKRFKVGHKIQNWLAKKSHFEIEVRLTFALIVMFATISEKLGFHSVVGAFIAGLIISEIMPKTTFLKNKLESFGYGFFIPIFFIFVGSKIDIPSLFSSLDNVLVLVLIVVVGLVAKFVPVTIAARLSGAKLRRSFVFGFLHMARLSLIIAAADIGFSLGLLDNILFSSLMILAVVSAIIGPVFGRIFLHKDIKNKKKYDDMFPYNGA